ncbi:MAG: hypothetical protein A2Y38_01440 [Spirochaetes bacterium GWB1_59_5]|nr:MAG: hypothetical protein A2Y38_01440 [Spirochaetes bacterium GWB1_59_5]
MTKKTRLDLMLDQVKCGKREITFDVDGYTKKQVARVRAAAKARGLHISGTNRWILVRDLSCG